MSPSDRLALAERSLDGLSVGDAFGERVFGPEHRAVERIDQREVPGGRWAYTDDTEMALAIVEVLEAKAAIDQDVLADVFARRYRANPLRGYGPKAHVVLEQLEKGVPWRVAARSVFGGEGSLGNGGAMRSAPIGAYFFDDEAAVIDNARRSAEVTHAHPDGQAGAIAVALAAAFVARAPEVNNGDELLPWVTSRVPEGATRRGLEQAMTIPLDAPVARALVLGTGQDVRSSDTVPFSVWCAARHLGDFEESVWTTVSGLGDRDTTCAIVGGIVALHRRSVIPTAWLDARQVLERRSCW